MVVRDLVRVKARRIDLRANVLVTHEEWEGHAGGGREVERCLSSGRCVMHHTSVSLHAHSPSTTPLAPWVNATLKLVKHQAAQD